MGYKFETQSTSYAPSLMGHLLRNYMANLITRAYALYSHIVTRRPMICLCIVQSHCDATSDDLHDKLGHVGRCIELSSCIAQVLLRAYLHAVPGNLESNTV